MALDNLSELSTPTKSRLPIFQKITLGIEILLVLIMLVGYLFKTSSFPRASELLIISLTSLSFVYVILPILLFKSEKIGGHLLVHFAGLMLFCALMGALFKIESWPYANEMILSAQLALTPLIMLLFLLFAINLKNKKRLFLYLRIGLRITVLILLFRIY